MIMSLSRFKQTRTVTPVVSVLQRTPCATSRLRLQLIFLVRPLLVVPSAMSGFWKLCWLVTTNAIIELVRARHQKRSFVAKIGRSRSHIFRERKEIDGE